MTDLELDARTWDGLEYLESVSGPGAIAELIQGFVHDAGPRLDRMNAALAASERESLRGLAHDLKTNAATVGALQLSSLGAGIERSASTGSPADLAAMLDEAGSLLPRVLAALEARAKRYPV
ncbi:MAG TPA: Hpt domain-containing protein [Holophaga sp.]|nr:Hpt domain-containing protein [Holophaga sp.]HPS67257.1 Hpt domain-containing protein [Holophaga sp.]